MTDYQQKRLFILNNRIKNQAEARDFFKTRFKNILVLSIFASITVVTLGFLNDPKRLASPETYDYSPMIYFMAAGFTGLISIILIAHTCITLQSNYLIKQYRKEENIILDAIERNKLDFERYENFSEIDS